MMMLGLAPIDTGDKVYSITPSAMSTGAVTSLTGFTLGADPLEIKATSAYGSTAKVFGRIGSYLGGPAFSEPIFETKARGRDVVVTTWSRLGQILLRADRTTGRALQIKWTGQATDGELSVDWVNNLPSTFAGIYTNRGVLGASGFQLFATNDLASYVTGWDTSSTDGDEFEFSVIANVLTVKWNGQTVFTTDRIWYHMVPGHVIYVTGGSEGALRDTEITFKASEATYTDGENRILDFRDWGWSSQTTTGSMLAGSTTLTVASAAGFSIGDPILVQTGGEAGAGLKNTVGVGGNWPRDSVANAASLPDATTYRADNGATDCYIWVEDVESVYINYLESGVPTWGEWTDYVRADTVRARGLFHTTWRHPKALKATITNISGTTITLDTPSVAATTNATVYYNCKPILEDIFDLSEGTGYQQTITNQISPDGWEVRFPSGTFCVPGRYVFPYTENWTFKGAGRSSTTLLGPKGAAVPSFKFYGEYMTVSDFKVQGWAGINYCGFDETTEYPDQVESHAIQTPAQYRSGGVFERLDFENTWGGISLTTRFGTVARDCSAVMSNGNLQQYASWFFTIVYTDENCWMEDITYTADEVGNAFEIYQANGGGFRRCTATQGVFSSNSSGGGWLMEDIVADVDWTARTTELDWLLPAAIINPNVNAGSGVFAPHIIEEGGTIRNPTITVVKDAGGNMYPAITVNTVNITIEGTHPAKPGEGVITMSDWEVTDVDGGAIGISVAGIDAASGCVVRGIRVIGATEPTDGFTMRGNILGTSDTVIENNVAEIMNRSGNTTNIVGTDGNITNAEYEALP